VLLAGPFDYGPPVGYWAFLRDPDGHTLEVSHGQEVGLAVGEASDPSEADQVTRAARSSHSR
jgi:hypothetical protein